MAYNSADGFMRMYESIKVSRVDVQAPAPRHGEPCRESSGSTSEARSPTSTTPPPPVKTTTPGNYFRYDLPYAPQTTSYPQGWANTREEYPGFASKPLPPLPSAAMEDFSEGRLETTVDTPVKELPGTKDSYVSYLVSTKVSFRRCSLVQLVVHILTRNASPTSNRSNAPNSAFAGVSQTSFFYGNS